MKKIIINITLVISSLVAYSQAILTPTEAGVDFYKTTENNKYMTITADGQYTEEGFTEVYIYFENGILLQKKEVYVSVFKTGEKDVYENYAMFEVSESEIKLLSENKITDVSINKNDKKITSFSAEKIKVFAKCLLN